MSAVLTFDIARDRRELDVTRRIAEERPDGQEFIVLLMRARKRRTVNSELIWWDDRPWSWITQIDNVSGYDDQAATNQLKVADASIFAPKDVVLNMRTQEQMFITAVDTDTDTITVIRGYGTSRYAMVDEDKLMWLANAMEENSLAPASKIAQPTKRYNYTQTVRTPFDESETSATDNLRTSETERQRLRRKKLLDHRLALERTAIWGKRHEDQTNKRRLTNGIDAYILTNEFDADGLLTERKFFGDFSEMCFKYGSKTKLLVTSPLVGGIINDFAMGKIQTSSGERTYGLQLNYIQTFHGRLYIVTSQNYEHDFAGWGHVLDMANIWYRPKQQRDTKLRTNIQENDRDGWRDEYLTEFAMQVELEKTHVRLINAA